MICKMEIDRKKTIIIQIISLLLLFFVMVVGPNKVEAAITQEQFDSRISQLRSKYPNYSTWTNADGTSRYFGGTECWGFAWWIGNEVFGSNPSGWTKKYNINEVKKGDILRYGPSDSDGHSLFVTNVSGDKITFVDCNGSGSYENKVRVRYCGVLWDQTISKSAVLWGRSNRYYSYHWSSPGVTTDPNWDNPDKHTVPTRNIYYTSPVMTGDDVTWIQCVLNKLGISCSIDGSYGPGTKSAVTTFQSKNGLDQDGSCGPATREKLKSEWAKLNGDAMTVGYDRALPDGDYYIASAADRKYYMDIQGGDFPAKSPTNVTLWSMTADDPSVQDVWTVTYNASDKFYTIKQKGANIALDVDGGSKASGANVQAYTANSSSAQKWAITYLGTKGYRVQSKRSGLSLDIANGKLANSTNIRQHESNDSDAQAWVFIPYKPAQPVKNGRYILTSAMGDEVELDVEGDTDTIANNTNVRIWDDSVKSRYNSFDITALDNGYYKLTNAASGKVLTVIGNSATYRDNTVVSDWSGGKNQQWAITPYGKGYILRAKNSGYVLNVQGYGVKANGTNVFQWPFNGPQDNQVWKLVQAEHVITYDKSIPGSGLAVTQSCKKYYKEPFVIEESVERDGWEFLGWSTSKDAKKPEYKKGDSILKEEDITLYPVWTQNSVICFEMGYEADAPEEQYAATGNPIGELPTVERTGYDFLGWFTEEEAGEQVSKDTICTGDMTLYAHWKAISYSITLDGNGGTVNGGNTDALSVTFGQPYGALPAAIRENYIQQGWYDADGNKVEPEDVVVNDASHTLYAHWKGEMKTLTFIANGGELEGNDETEAEYGAALGQLPVPVRDNYKFTGWFTNRTSGKNITSDSVCDGDLTVFAHWEEDPNWHTHEYEVKDETAASCETAGSRTLVCRQCGEEKTEAIPAIGSHSWSEWETVAAASCDHAGEKKRVCTVCGKEETDSIPATGEHDFSKWYYEKTPTDTEAGSRVRTCYECGFVQTEEIPPCTEHQWGEWRELSAATCIESGSRERACQNCGKKQLEETQPTGIHEFGNWETRQEPTETTEGIAVRTCVHCGEEEQDTIPVLVHEHSWSGWTVVTPATYDAEGLAIRICTKDNSHTETRPIEKLVQETPAPTPAPAPAGAQQGAAEQASGERITISKTPSLSKPKVAAKGKVTISWKKFKRTKKTKAIWKQIKGIEIQISTDATFTTDVIGKRVGRKKTSQKVKLQRNTRYYVRIRYVDGNGGVSAWSKVKKVKTK